MCSLIKNKILQQELNKNHKKEDTKKTNWDQKLRYDVKSKISEGARIKTVEEIELYRIERTQKKKVMLLKKTMIFLQV